MIYSVFVLKVNTAVPRILKVFVCVCVCVCVCGHNDLLLNFAREAKFLAGDICFFFVRDVRVHKQVSARIN